MILAGGRGTRLAAATLTKPKPMLDISGKPFLEYLILYLHMVGITDVLLSIGYLGNQIRDHFGSGNRFGVRIDYIEEKTPLGTGGGLTLGRDKLASEFLVVNGDTIFDFDIADLYSLYHASNAYAAIALRSVNNVDRYGNVSLEGELIQSMAEKESTGKGLISAGTYIFSKKVIEDYAKMPCSIETDIFPALITKQQLIGKSYDGYFIDIGVPSSLEVSQSQIPHWWASLND